MPKNDLEMTFLLPYRDRCRSGSGALSILFVAATSEAINDKIKKRKHVEDSEFFTEVDEDPSSPV